MRLDDIVVPDERLREPLHLGCGPPVTLLAQTAYAFGRAHRNGFLYAGLHWFRSAVGVPETLTLVGPGLFVGFVFLFSRRSLAYLENVTQTLQQVSLGRLNIQAGFPIAGSPIAAEPFDGLFEIMYASGVGG